ncbi:helix-turn-helix transcriptional regulator [Candidatus Nomurabacteria bacterium]|nr:helix-turn-helix transcriptional regulator [Candidatus Nomurabacteria bacterium]
MSAQAHEFADNQPLYLNGPQNLGERLRFQRRRQRLTQEQLAILAGTNQAVIQKIENGKSLRPRKINELAAALEVNVAWLQCGIGDSTPLSDEAIEVAKSWMKLYEHERAQVRDLLQQLAR